MIQLPLFSIILTTYNRAHVLDRAIKSVLNQTFKNFELILVNGGSLDNTESIVQAYADERIRYFKQSENKGMLSDRNIGFDMSRGKYVAVLDDDDELMPEALETAINEFNEISEEIGVLVFNCVESKSRRLCGMGIRESRYVPFEEYLSGKIYGNFWEIFKNDLVKKDRFDERLWGAEKIFLWQLYQKTKVFYSHKVLKINHPECSSVSQFESQFEHLSRIIFSNKVLLEKFGNQRRICCPKNYAQDLADLGFWQILNGEKREGRETCLTHLTIRILQNLFSS